MTSSTTITSMANMCSDPNFPVLMYHLQDPQCAQSIYRHTAFQISPGLAVSKREQ
jgi:hypothetical protein